MMLPATVDLYFIGTKHIFIYKLLLVFVAVVCHRNKLIICISQANNTVLRCCIHSGRLCKHISWSQSTSFWELILKYKKNYFCYKSNYEVKPPKN